MIFKHSYFQSYQSSLKCPASSRDSNGVKILNVTGSISSQVMSKTMVTNFHLLLPCSMPSISGIEQDKLGIENYLWHGTLVHQPNTHAIVIYSQKIAEILSLTHSLNLFTVPLLCSICEKQGAIFLFSVFCVQQSSTLLVMKRKYLQYEQLLCVS